jgi:hypothetical protein
MKKLFFTLIVFTLILGSCYAPYCKLNSEEKDAVMSNIKPFELTKVFDNERDLFYIVGQNLKEVQNTLKDKNNRLVIIFFNWWCPSFSENRERIVKLVESYPNVKPIYITSDDFREYPRYREKYQNILNSDIYMIDVVKYGNGKRNPHKRQEPFVEEICPECLEKTGFPTLIVFDNKRELLFNPSTIDSLEFVQLEESLRP